MYARKGEERTEGENRAEDVGTSKKGACMKRCAVYAEKIEKHRMQEESAELKVTGELAHDVPVTTTQDRHA